MAGWLPAIRWSRLLALARRPRATYALMLALLPAVAVVVGAVVLHQIPSVRELTGIALVIAGIAIHQADTT